VGTLMTNLAVELALKQKGLEFIRTQVGDRYVLQALQEKGWLLGGEGSGHLLALDKHSTGDGLISALQVLQACVASGKSMAQLLSDVQLFPQVLVNVRLKPGQEPLVRVMVEARDARLAQASAEKLAATLENEEAVRAQ
ncbi:MAG: phosphoglucosamine mutase, partial [Rhodoferax sp.]|nr:phosphoglucosamine mutase [Rhodoferax sp.]